MPFEISVTCRWPRRYIRLVRRALLVATVGATIAVAGCSSSPPPSPPQPGSLVAGTAAITVNDNDLGQFESVQCTPAGTVTTITTGDDSSGTTAVVSNSDGLSAQLISIRDLGGFTGSYNQGLGGQAKVVLSGNTYTITGTADGFNTDAPSFRTNGTFTIKVAC